MDSKDRKILSYFRRNARENLTTAARNINIPISTIYDKLKRMENTVITKHTALVDFAMLGYGLKVSMILKVAPPDKKRLGNFLIHHPRVNSVCEISNECDYMAEVIFKNLWEVSRFVDSLAEFDIQHRHEYYVVTDLKREDFFVDFEAADLCFPQQMAH